MGAKKLETSCKTIHSERLRQAYHIRDRPVRLALVREKRTPFSVLGCVPSPLLMHNFPACFDWQYNQHLPIIFPLMLTMCMG